METVPGNGLGLGTGSELGRELLPWLSPRTAGNGLYGMVSTGPLRSPCLQHLGGARIREQMGLQLSVISDPKAKKKKTPLPFFSMSQSFVWDVCIHSRTHSKRWNGCPFCREPNGIVLETVKSSTLGFCRTSAVTCVWLRPRKGNGLV